MPRPVNVRAVNQAVQDWPINTTTNIRAGENVVEGPGASAGGSLGLLLTLTQA